MGDDQPAQVCQDAPAQDPLHASVRQGRAAGNLHLLQAPAPGQQGVQGRVACGRVGHSPGQWCQGGIPWGPSRSSTLGDWVLHQEEADCANVFEHP